MNINIKNLFVCPNCEGNIDLEKFNSDKGDIIEGVFTCKKCKSWYPIIDGVVNFLSEDLVDKKERKDFQEKWKLDFSERKKEDSDSEGKLKQIDFFKEDAEKYDDELENTSFWRAQRNKVIIGLWLAGSEKGQYLLDIGCGTGNASIPFAKKGLKVIGVDISKEMVMNARKRVKDQNLSENSEFIVADAENLPFKKGTFDRCIAYGVLHHVEDPKIVLNSISKILKTGGLFFGHENNKSKFRFIFDIAMKIWKQWDEEAGTHPLISEKEIKDWGLKSSLLVEAKTNVFLPPHLFNIVGDSNAEKLLSFSDNLFSSLPFWKHQGGALLIKARKI